MRSAQVLAFEQDLDATVEAAFAARNRLIRRRARRWDDRGWLSYRTMTLLSAAALFSVFVLAPFWAPRHASDSSVIWSVILWLTLPPSVASAVYVAEAVDLWVWSRRVYPLPIVYDRAVCDLLDRCGKRGLDKRQVKYLFSLARADASLNISFFETIWKYGGGTAAGVFFGARMPWYIAGPAFIIALASALRVTTKLIDPAIRMSQLAASVEHHCK